MTLFKSFSFRTIIKTLIPGILLFVGIDLCWKLVHWECNKDTKNSNKTEILEKTEISKMLKAIEDSTKIKWIKRIEISEESKELDELYNTECSDKSYDLKIGDLFDHDLFSNNLFMVTFVVFLSFLLGILCNTFCYLAVLDWIRNIFDNEQKDRKNFSLIIWRKNNKVISNIKSKYCWSRIIWFILALRFVKFPFKLNFDLDEKERNTLKFTKRVKEILENKCKLLLDELQNDENKKLIRWEYLLSSKIDREKYIDLRESYWFYMEFCINSIFALIPLFVFSIAILIKSIKGENIINNETFPIIIPIFIVFCFCLIFVLLSRSAIKNYITHEKVVYNYYLSLLLENDYYSKCFNS